MNLVTVGMFVMIAGMALITASLITLNRKLGSYLFIIGLLHMIAAFAIGWYDLSHQPCYIYFSDGSCA